MTGNDSITAIKSDEVIYSNGSN